MVATTYKRFTKVLFVVLNLFAAFIYLLACLSPYVNPHKFWFISLLGLGFAFYFITLIAFIFFWVIFKPRFILISLITIAIGWKSIVVFFAFHLSPTFDYVKPAKTLRVVHWNVARFIEWRKNNNKGSQTRQKMMDLIKLQNADVICMQEFFSSTDPQYYNNIHYISSELGYPYYYYSMDNDGGDQYNGQVIFSKFPFIDSGIIRYSAPSIPESLIHVDLAFQGDTIRIYTTHLQSVQFRKQDYDRIEKIKEREKGLVENSKNIFSKLKRGIIFRCGQADEVRNNIADCPYPFILTGDFNDVPNSYTYFTILDEQLQDAFLSRGLGIGRTYSNIAPTLRIDYILTTKQFKIRQFNRIVKNLSDHYMLVCDLELP